MLSAAMMKCIMCICIFGSIWGSLASNAVKEDHVRAVNDENFLSRNARMLTLGELSEPFQLLSQYSYGSIRECPDKFQMDIADSAEADFVSGTFDVPYSKVNIELGNWFNTRLNMSNNLFAQIECAGPKSNSVLTLQSGTTVSTSEFIRLHSHSPSTITLFKALVPRLRTGNYWLSAPEVSPFHCSKNGLSMGAPWFAEKFTFIFFCEPDVVPVSFIGKVRPDGSERLVRLNLTGTIRYFIATAPQTTCIYRSVNDVQRYEYEQQKREIWEKANIVLSSVTPEPSRPPTKSDSPIVSKNPKSLVPTPFHSEYRTVFPSPSCTCTCDYQFPDDNRLDLQSPRYGRLSSKNPGRSQSDLIRKPHGAPYGPRPRYAENLDASMNPSSSWRWNWFWCSDSSSGGPGFFNRDIIEIGDIRGERACFPSTAIVETLDHGAIRMQDLKVGDKVKVGPNNQFSQVFAFSHSDSGIWKSFVSITTISGLTLVVSPGHLIPVDDGELFRADTIEVGQTVTTNAGLVDTVTSTSVVKAQGLYNPHTLSGSILVDGILTSCYTAAVTPSAAQAFLAPVRTVAKIISSIVVTD